MNFSFKIGRAPNKISLNFINRLPGYFGEVKILHSISGDYIKGGFN